MFTSFLEITKIEATKNEVFGAQKIEDFLGIGEIHNAI